MKREFDEVDIADFRKEAYQKILKYFTQSIEEIDNVEGVRARISPIDAFSFTATVLNTQIRHGAGHITVHAKSRMHGFNDISYVFEENADPNTSNGGFCVECDDYNLYLTGGAFTAIKSDQKLQPYEAAEIIWNMLLKKSGIGMAA